MKFSVQPFPRIEHAIAVSVGAKLRDVPLHRKNSKPKYYSWLDRKNRFQPVLNELQCLDKPVWLSVPFLSTQGERTKVRRRLQAHQGLHTLGPVRGGVEKLLIKSFVTNRDKPNKYTTNKQVKGEEVFVFDMAIDDNCCPNSLKGESSIYNCFSV